MAALLIIAWLVLAWSHLDFFSFEDDEGTFLITAQALAHGHELYREVWFNYLSGLMAILTPILKLWPASWIAPRVLMTILTAVTGLVCTRIARRLAGQWAGAWTALLLLLSPGAARMGRSVMAEVPAIACSAIAVWSMLRYQERQRLHWLALAGLFAGLGIWFKYPTVVMLLPLEVSLIVYARHNGLPWRRFVALSALFLVSVLAPLIIAVSRYDLAAQWDQIPGTLFDAWSYYSLKVDNNFERLVDYIGDNNWGVAALALVGASLLRQERPSCKALLVSWPLAYILSMLVSTPLMSHHMLLFLPPLWILAAVTLSQVPTLLRSARSIRPSTRQRNSALAGVLAGCLLLVLFLPDTCDELSGLYHDDPNSAEDRKEVTALIARHTLPGDNVICDLPMITFRAGRQAPPWLTNTSGMRFRTGGLTEAMLMEALASYRPAAVVIWEEKFINSVPGFVAHVQSSYVEIYREHEDVRDDGSYRLHALYLRPDRAP